MINKKKNKDLYRNLCATIPEITLFSQDWWLDIACEGGIWEACLVFDKEGMVIGAMPYYSSKLYGFKVIKMPGLSPFFHIWLRYPQNQLKRHQKYAFEKRVLKDLIDQLPKVSYFSQRYGYAFTNWLPFYHYHFDQTTFYSYRIENLKNLDKVFSDFNSSVRNDIRKAQQEVEVMEGEDIALFYHINEMSFRRQNLNIPYSLEYLRKLDHALNSRKLRKIYFAKDEQGTIHAAIYIARDDISAYYLAGGFDAEASTRGVIHLLLWRAIQDASEIVNCFDFEGSMIPGVERMFCDFGGIQKPYFRIRKAGNAWIAGVKGFLDRRNTL